MERHKRHGLCIYCLTYTGRFRTCRTCGVTICHKCIMELDERLLCPDCFAFKVARIATLDETPQRLTC